MRTCARCGRENAADASFCSGCGTPLERERSREERKVVTVLFADLAGFTGRAEQLDPEDVRATLQQYHSRLRAELEHFGGTVEKFIGDAVMAVFGAPVVHEDDPERAVRAALAIRDQALDSELQLRIAVNTGEVLVALDARPAEGEAMVAGDVVNTAARLQAAAPVNGVLVGESTYRATAHVIEYRPAERITAKGKADPVPAWEAVAPKSRFGVDVEEAPIAPLVGRTQEVELVAGALARARGERRPQLVTLVGEPGIGKSRLVAELFSIVDDDPEIIHWRQGRCLPYGEGISYWAMGEMTKAQAGVLESDSAIEARRKLDEAVASLVPDAHDAEWVVRHLRPLLGLEGESPAGSEARGEAFAAWRRFFEALGERAPTVAVFEDLHWADDGLLDFVDGLVERAAGVPLLVLCSGRPELLARRPHWGGGKANAVTLSLSPLSDEDTARLVANLLDQAALPADTQRALLQRADGNPLFAEEYVRMLRDQGLLRREGDVWRLAGGDITLPETVQGIIAARLDALAAPEKAALQAAAVLGKVFWLGAVATIAEVPRWDAEELFHSLERKEFVRRDRRASVGGETELAFRHVLVRDVAYGQIPRVPRSELHARAADWIETLGDERGEDRAEMLAHHFAAAVDLGRAAGADVAALLPRAVAALRAAGDRARTLGAYGSALRHYERALGLDPAAADDPWMLLGIGDARMMLNSGGEEELTRAALALETIDPGAAAEAEMTHGELLWHRGDHDAAFTYFDRAQAMVNPLPSSQAKAYVLGQIARFRLLAGYLPDVLELTGQVIDIAEQHADEPLLGDVLNTRGIARAISGDHEAGIADLEQSLELQRRSRSNTLSRAYLNLGSTLTDTAIDVERAERLFREGLPLSEEREQPLAVRWFRGNLADVLFLRGSWQECEALSDVEICNPDPHYQQVACACDRAMIRLARGDAEGARADSELSCGLARSIQDPQALMPALAWGAFCLASIGDTAGAVDLLTELRHARAQSEVHDLPGFWTVMLALVSFDLGRPFELGDADFPRSTPWFDAASAIGRGELAEAAEILRGAGGVAPEAMVRLRLGRRLVAEGNRAAAEAELGAALAFFRSVDAVADVRAAEALLPAAS